MRITALAILLLIALLGCRSAQRNVSFSVFGDPAELAAYEALVAAFEAQHPTIDVVLNHIPDAGDYRRRLATAFASGAPPDVFLLNYRRVAAFAGDGGLEPLGAYLAAEAAPTVADFYPIAIDAFTWRGRLWCVPQNVSSLVVYYNRALFDAAGVRYPTDDWTRDDFLSAARALTRDRDGDGQTDQYGAAIEPSLYRLAPMIWQNGGELVDDLQRPTRLALDSPPAIAALTWFSRLQTHEHVVPDLAAETARDGEARFLDGTLAMFFSSRRSVPTLRTVTAFTWDVAPLPGGPQAAGVLHSDGYCMAAKTADKQAAWTFIAFANSVAGQMLVARSGRTVPSLRAVAESDAFLDPAQAPANSRVFIETLATLRTVPLLAQWVAIEETAGTEIERAFYGALAPEDAARRTIETTRGFFAP